MPTPEPERKIQESEQIVVEVVRIKLSSSIHTKRADRKYVLGRIEADYGRAKKYRTNENKLQPGTILGIPYNESLIGITLFLSIMDSNHDLSEDVGESIIRPLKSDDRFHDLDHVPMDCSADITRNRGREKVGKIVYKISRVSVFADKTLHNEEIKKKTDKREELNVLSALPDFRFNRLAKPIHWERLKGLNLARIVHGIDITTLMTVADDVAVGDVSLEDVDQKLLRTLQLSQYSVQYLLGCQTAMKSNKKMINESLKVFDREEALLDLRLAKMRTRSKALKRENASLDTLHSEYSELLLALDPTLMKAYKQSLKSDQSLPSKKAFLSDFSSAKNAGGFFKGKEVTHNGINEEDIAMKTDKSSSHKHSKRREKTDFNTESRNSEDSYPPTLRQDERMQSRQSEVEDRARNRKSDHTGNDSWERRGHRSLRSEDNTAKATPSSSSHNREQKSPDDRRRKSYSSSDSEDSSKFRTKQSSRWGQKYQDGDKDVDGGGDGDGMGVIVSSPEDMHPRVSLSEPDIRPRVTFHSSDSNSISGADNLNKKVDSDGRGADTVEGFGRNVSNEARVSAGWSTMDSQYSVISADSLGATEQPKTSEPVMTNSTWANESNYQKKALSFPEISDSPAVIDNAWPDIDNEYNDVEVIELNSSSRVLSVPVPLPSNIPDTEYTDPKSFYKTNSAPSVPLFAPVAAAISTRWSMNHIDAEIASSKQYDSDRSHNSSTNNSPPKHHRASSKSFRAESPQAKRDSDSELDSPPLPKNASPKRTNAESLTSDQWEAKKEMNKFNTFLNNNKSTDFSSNRNSIDSSSSVGKNVQSAHTLATRTDKENLKGPAKSGSSAYTDFIRKGSVNRIDDTRVEVERKEEAERREVKEYGRDFNSQSSEVSRALKNIEDSPAASKEMKRRNSNLEDHEDLFERPSRSSLSSTFPKSGGLSVKQQMDLDRLSKTSSSFNNDDASDFFVQNEDDGIDTSASVTLNFLPSGQPVSPTDQPSESSTSAANKLFQDVQTKSEVRDSVKSNVYALNNTQSSLSDEDTSPETLRSQVNKNDSDADSTNDNMHTDARGLHFTIRDSEDRSSGSARVEPRTIARPDSTEEADDDVLYGTMRFGETRTVSSSYDGAHDSKPDALLLKPKVLESLFGTMTAISANLKKEAKISASRTSSDVRNTSGRIEQGMDASYHPSDSGNSSSNSMEFTLSQSTVPLNNQNQSDNEKRHSKEEELLRDPETAKPEAEPLSTDDAPSSLRWQSGRAPTELIETGRAFDVFVSALKLHDDSLISVSLQLEFLGLRSDLSPKIPHSAITTVQPVNFSSYISSAPEIFTLLTDEIHAEGEYLSFRINLIDIGAGSTTDVEGSENVLAQGSVALWVMIEDSCSILRQEVDILDCASEEIIGFVVVDVRGHRLLKECS